MQLDPNPGEIEWAEISQTRVSAGPTWGDIAGEDF